MTTPTNETKLLEEVTAEVREKLWECIIPAIAAHTIAKLLIEERERHAKEMAKVNEDWQRDHRSFNEAAKFSTDMLTTLRSENERLREALSKDIFGQSFEEYLFYQYPMTRGHIPIQEWFASAYKALQPPTA